MGNKGSFIQGSLLSPQYEVFVGKFLRMQHQAAGIEITTAVCGYTDRANSKNAKLRKQLHKFAPVLGMKGKKQGKYKR
ncbi:MAG TPA: hypothetical protein VGQ55_02420 [Pyrinomonadaceae bacterium]|nr:hypothetical protein [Pyrinomonadaceae bacterium]